MLESIIPHISVNLVRYLQRYSEGHVFSPDVLKSGMRLIESVASYLMPLVQSLTLGMKNDELVDFFFVSLLSRDFDPHLVVSLTKAAISNILIGVTEHCSGNT